MRGGVAKEERDVKWSKTFTRVHPTRFGCPMNKLDVGSFVLSKTDCFPQLSR